MSTDVDQATVDRWLADGRWVMFGEGVSDPCDHKRYSCDDIGCMGPLLPPAWMVEAARPCETCEGEGAAGMFCNAYADPRMSHPCNGKRRLAVTVPCLGCEGDGWERDQFGSVLVECRCYDDLDGSFGRITVAWATVEWGPLVVVGFGIVGGADCVLLSDDTRATPPPDIDPHTLIGLWAIGGGIEVASC